ncbi:3903_t:CDS:2 [Ambispora gerdemannii]|uniref:3903_t:CDS:1 n=1 Tax=Ambispora gerdemannii TaxID=144530 RepID=A0A9N8VL27_9GLOM|nr:3903_t:CDS:2 [Ambispora gerdemannii]
MADAQKYVDKYYSKDSKGLEIRNKGLEGDLNLSDFVNLEELDCSENKLSGLKISNCPKLKTIQCNGNKLTKLNLVNCPEVSELKIDDNLLSDYSIFDDLSIGLIHLDIRDNNFEPKGLTFLSKFTSLETLKLGRKRNNYMDNYRGSKTNAFGGSLEPLEKMTKLKELRIINTNISGGLRYLPNSLKKIRCGFTPLSNYDCRKICEELKDYKIEEYEYDLQSWREADGQNETTIEPQITKAEKDEIRNILIVGITGNGKSALANTLVNKNGKFEKVFEEGDSSVKYRVIDNVGFGDSGNLALPDILHTIGQAIRSADEKINQVLFVFKDRFTDEQIKTFNLFKDFISQSRIIEFTTIIKTSFSNFDKLDECKNDQKNLLHLFEQSRDEKKKKFGEIIKQCGFIHVNNPPLPIINLEVNDSSEIRKDEEEERKLIDDFMKKKREIEAEISAESNLRKKANMKDGLKEVEKKFAEEISIRLGLSPITFETFIEIGLVSLDVSNCPNLEELDCQNNQINSLNVTGCSNLRKINFSNNYIKELDLSTCTKLEEVNINNCPELTIDKIKTELYHDAKKEKDSSTSITKNFLKSNIFQWQGKKYCVIDNIGFDTNSNLTKSEILYKIGEGIHSAKEGINQILFVFKGRFSPEQIAVFNLLKDFISEIGITKFTTIVRTSFTNFRNHQKCEEDKWALLSKSKELSEIINSCNGIIYIDNPSMPVVEEEDSDNELEIRINEKKRKESRKILLDYLTENCQEIYKLKE